MGGVVTSKTMKDFNSHFDPMLCSKITRQLNVKNYYEKLLFKKEKKVIHSPHLEKERKKNNK